MLCSSETVYKIGLANISTGKQLEALLCCLTSEKIYFREKISFQPPWEVSEFGHALRNDNDYMLPNPRIEFFKKIPLYSLPSAWNDAGDIRYQQNRLTIKIALKEKLLDDVNND